MKSSVESQILFGRVTLHALLRELGVTDALLVFLFLLCVNVPLGILCGYISMRKGHDFLPGFLQGFLGNLYGVFRVFELEQQTDYAELRRKRRRSKHVNVSNLGGVFCGSCGVRIPQQEEFCGACSSPRSGAPDIPERPRPPQRRSRLW